MVGADIEICAKPKALGRCGAIAQQCKSLPAAKASAKPCNFNIRAFLLSGAPYTQPMRSASRHPAKPSDRVVPDPLPIEQALRQHEGLARLGLLIRESNRRMDTVRPALPGALSRFVKPGPVDEEGWTVLAANAAVAAKLRHLQPRLEQMLLEAGLLPARVRVKVQQA